MSQSEVRVDPGDDVQAARELINRCLAGDAPAIRRFQEQYGELIYAYPLRLYRTAAESAGEFYLFAFENGRIFRRARTYAGRAPFRAYLLAVLLDHLFIDWKRTMREVETVALDESDGSSEHNALAFSSADNRIGSSVPLHELLKTLEPAKAVVLKLLHVEDCELDAEELCYLTEVSRRPVPEVIAAVESLRATVRGREVQLQRVADTLDTVHAWIGVYQSRLQRLEQDLRELPPTSSAAARGRSACMQLETHLRRRQHQQAKLLAERRRRKVTAPYKDIAAILNTSVGNVASQIARARQELAQRVKNYINREGDSV